MNNIENDFPSLFGHMIELHDDARLITEEGDYPIVGVGINFGCLTKEGPLVHFYDVKSTCLDKQRVREAINEEFGCHCVDEEVECWGCKMKKRLNL